VLARRIEIKNRKGFKDGKAEKTRKLILEDARVNLDNLEIVNCYNIFAELNDDELKTIEKELFCDRVFQESASSFHFAKITDYSIMIEVSYKSGVTDNVGRTASKGIGDILKRKIDESMVRGSTIYFLTGNISKDIAKNIAEKVLCNSLIEEYYIFTKSEIIGGSEVVYSKPEISSIVKPYFNAINLNITDTELMKISDKNALYMSLEEMKAVRDYYRRQDIIDYRRSIGLPSSPTDVELEMLAQTWSEHCKHKIFAAEIQYTENGKTDTIHSLFKTFIRDSAFAISETRDDLLSLFTDNAGVVKFNDEWAYCVKAETHNSPSALDPYGGAMTGIVGVNRDIIGTGIGAYPIFNTDIFCFGDPFTDESDVPAGLLHPKRIFRGVHRGVKDGGNESGIPTVNGSIVFDKSYLGKPLVFCGTGGILPLKINGKESYKKYHKPGDLIVMVGGRIGKDGIHGATFSSAHLSETSPTTAVQIGDPITQKKMLDFIIEARDRGLYSSLTDNGAGGLSSSIGEMATFTGGAVLELDKCPLKYNGLRPWEILVSEAQERMSIAVPKDSIEKFLNLSSKHGVESTVIGEFTDNGFFKATYNDETVCQLEMDFLHDGVPKMTLEAVWTPPEQKHIDISTDSISDDIINILKRPNIASKESWVRCYDHEVQARTVNKPFTGKKCDGPSDGAVLKMFPDSYEGLVVTHGIVPRYSRIDAYQMAANAIDEAYRQAIILGANPDKIVGLDNFCWPDPIQSEYTPDGKYKLAQLVQTCKAVYDLTTAYSCPCISGKDSMKNDYKRGDIKISVDPTLLFTVTGKTDDIRLMSSSYFKKTDDLIYLIGETRQELGCSEYALMKGVTGGVVPTVNPYNAMISYRQIHESLQEKIIRSAHDLSDGGLAVALCESAFSGETGVIVSLDPISDDLSPIEKLFSESPSRILVSIDPDDEKRFIEIFKGTALAKLGRVTEDRKVRISHENKEIFAEDIDILKKTWKEVLDF